MGIGHVEIMAENSFESFLRFLHNAGFLRVLCGTGREFAVGVPREVKTALEGQAWIQNRPLQDFVKPEVRS
jgi:hypothetical protein